MYHRVRFSATSACLHVNVTVYVCRDIFCTVSSIFRNSSVSEGLQFDIFAGVNDKFNPEDAEYIQILVQFYQYYDFRAPDTTVNLLIIN